MGGEWGGCAGALLCQMSAWPVCTDNLFDLLVCACVCLCIHLFFPHNAGCGGVKVGTLGGGNHIQTSY